MVNANYQYTSRFILSIISVCTLTARDKINTSLLNAISDAHIRRKQRHVKFSCRLAKVAQTAQKACNQQCHDNAKCCLAAACSEAWFLHEITVTFLQISRKPQLPLEIS